MHCREHRKLRLLGSDPVLPVDAQPHAAAEREPVPKAALDDARLAERARPRVERVLFAEERRRRLVFEACRAHGYYIASCTKRFLAFTSQCERDAALGRFGRVER
jgi:hypothetical protein